MEKNKINLGSGEDYKEDHINIDIRKNVKTDLRWDLNNIPYPFKENSFTECFMDCVLASVNNPIEVLKEASRIVKPGGRVIVITPHPLAYSYFSGITHTAHFTENSFAEKNLQEYELEDKLELIRTEFIFMNKWKKYIPFKKYLKIFFRGIYDDIKFEFEVK